MRYGDSLAVCLVFSLVFSAAAQDAEALYRKAAERENAWGQPKDWREHVPGARLARKAGRPLPRGSIPSSPVTSGGFPTGGSTGSSRPPHPVPMPVCCGSMTPMGRGLTNPRGPVVWPK
jgi:hypothetical protein